MAPVVAVVLVFVFEVVVVIGSAFGEAGGADEEDEEEDDREEETEEDPAESEEAFVDELVEETFLADSAALFRTIRLIEDTEGRLSSSQIPSSFSWFRISQANIVGFAFL